MEQRINYWCPLYYATPIQLKYFESESRTYKFGFGFHNFVIDGETGELKWIPDLVNEGRKLGVDMDTVIVERGWEPLGD